MEQDLETEDILRQYLLGQLTEDLQQRVEERLMTDNRFSEQLSAVEEDLVDDYAAGRLIGADKIAFEGLFLAHPGRQQQVEFARALQIYARSGSAPQKASASPTLLGSGFLGLLGFIRGQSFAFKAALAVAGLTVVLGGGWLIFEASRLEQQVARLIAQQKATEKERVKLAQELENERGRGSHIEDELTASKSPQKPEAAESQHRPTFVAITLLPGLVRDSGRLPRIVLPEGKDFVQLELLLDGESYEKYNAVLQTAEGTRVWEQTGLRVRGTPTGDSVVLRLSRGVLKPQDYALRLAGISPEGASEAAGTYYFRVSSK